ncbi:hypothetical protein [Paracoccus sp. (in: a-proteobacteria)]|uniref:hypothetical protein n=1 Tax=Paracoccus sp. TaxID=267 RepID=UPI002898C134|nr:hypothetical protein [Paracoccus sp. (in: a-proteobacteria)]
MGAIEIIGYLLASIDLFDKTEAAEVLLRRILIWMRRVSARIPLRFLLSLYLLSAGAFGLYKKLDTTAVAMLSPASGVEPSLLRLMVMFVLMSPAIFVMLMLVIRLMQATLAIFSRHPKGIMGSIGLVVTAIPSLIEHVL